MEQKITIISLGGTNMKCIMSLDEKHIKRVTDEEASELFHEGGWRYVAKSVWKEKVRDVETKEEIPKGNIKSNKMSTNPRYASSHSGISTMGSK